MSKIKKACKNFDSELYELIEKEKLRQMNTIQLNAAENITSKKVLFPLISNFSSKTAEGAPGKRYHLGCEIVDEMERLGEKRLCELFNSKQVWLQPLSGSMANFIVIQSILEEYLPHPADAKIFAMKLDQGGHLSHSSKYNITGKIFKNTKYYSVDKNSYLLDYDKIYQEAKEYKPHLIICGASSYPREIDFKKFGEIAQDCNAVLLCDISHILGLVATGVHQNPTEYSSFITSSTYKAGGPHGGIIIAGKRSTETQRAKINKYVFPVIQSTPDFGSIASKTAFFKEIAGDEYHQTQKNIVRNAKALARYLKKRGYNILTGGTDNHIILIDILSTHKITGKEASEKLSLCGIYTNRNLIPFDTQNVNTCSGIRLGTNTISRVGMKEGDVKRLAGLIDLILTTDLNNKIIKKMRRKVQRLINEFTLKSTNYFNL